MATRFSSVWPYWGVDDQASPHPWMMVPQNGQNHVLLRDGAGMTVRSRGVNITVTEINGANVGHVPNPFASAALNVSLTHRARLFSIGGTAPGRATVEVVDSHGRVQATLDCAVKRRKTVRAAFNFVRDNAGHMTTRHLGDVNGWLNVINRIFLYQANIAVQNVEARWVQVNQNLGSVVRFVSARLSRQHGIPRAQHEWDDVVAKRHNGADWNVFLVWEYEQDRTPNIDNANAGTLGGDTLCEDRVRAEPAETMAHELGHYLGLDHPTAGNTGNWLMADASRTGNKIPKQDVNIANP
jgi:hypothetical protein